MSEKVFKVKTINGQQYTIVEVSQVSDARGKKHPHNRVVVNSISKRDAEILATIYNNEKKRLAELRGMFLDLGTCRLELKESEKKCKRLEKFRLAVLKYLRRFTTICCDFGKDGGHEEDCAFHPGMWLGREYAMLEKGGRPKADAKAKSGKEEEKADG